jgi:hypothetical protein
MHPVAGAISEGAFHVECPPAGGSGRAARLGRKSASARKNGPTQVLSVDACGGVHGTASRGGSSSGTDRGDVPANGGRRAPSRCAAELELAASPAGRNTRGPALALYLLVAPPARGRPCRLSRRRPDRRGACRTAARTNGARARELRAGTGAAVGPMVLTPSFRSRGRGRSRPQRCPRPRVRRP